MLSEYKGPSNSTNLLKHLPGERIEGAMIDKQHFVLVLESGTSLVLTASCGIGYSMCPSYWKEDQSDTKARIRKRQEYIKDLQSQLAKATSLLEEIR